MPTPSTSRPGRNFRVAGFGVCFPNGALVDQGVRQRLMAGVLESVERQLRRDPNVLDVVFRLQNFHKVRGKWEGAGV